MLWAMDYILSDHVGYNFFMTNEIAIFSIDQIINVCLGLWSGHHGVAQDIQV